MIIMNNNKMLGRHFLRKCMRQLSEVHSLPPPPSRSEIQCFAIQNPRMTPEIKWEKRSSNKVHNIIYLKRSILVALSGQKHLIFALISSWSEGSFALSETFDNKSCDFSSFWKFVKCFFSFSLRFGLGILPKIFL
ncbi:hypothetical protein RCL_jg11781.t1 [Rhizophagus clarus]|uniref:Uncharacterized protein n=1 Tax=Rhizophagus clarus TaxID=94130 RepID=A0A8H3R488_9GLOM|nr:hypothetical protein RCL_jg11781.t1 [Rhizophagus clarus]